MPEAFISSEFVFKTRKIHQIDKHEINDFFAVIDYINLPPRVMHKKEAEEKEATKWHLNYLEPKSIYYSYNAIAKKRPNGNIINGCLFQCKQNFIKSINNTYKLLCVVYTQCDAYEKCMWRIM